MVIEREGNQCFDTVRILGRPVRVPVPCPDVTVNPNDALYDAWRRQQEEEEAEEGGEAEGPISTAGTTTGEVTGETIRTTGGVEQFGTTGERVITGEETVRQTIRTYVDIPTPEQVLNDFETSQAAYIGSLVEQGLLNPADANLALTEIAPIFLNDYLGELGQRAAAGENIFRVVGAGGEPTFVGARIGEVTSTATTGTERVTGTQVTQIDIDRIIKEAEQRGETITTSEAVRQAEQEQIRTGTTTTTGKRTETTKEQEDVTRKETEDITTKREEDTSFAQTELIFERPELASVYKLSPGTFMMQRYGNAEALAGFIRSKKGVRARQQQTLAGGEVVSARRA